MTAVHDRIQTRLIKQMKAAQVRAARMERRIVADVRKSKQTAHQWLIETLGLASRAELRRLSRAVEALRPRAHH